MTLSAQLITIIIIVTLAGGFLLNLLADYYNIAHLKESPPDEFADICDIDKYKKAQAYLKENTKFGIITSSFDLAVLFIFWFAGGFQYLDTLVRSFGLPVILTGLLFTGILLFFKLIIGLPFTIYATFVIEETYGFNKTTAKTFILDLIKSVCLSVLLGGLLLAAILAFLDYGGPLAWILCWSATTIFMLILQYIVPTWIMPLFNKFTPLEEGELRQAIMAYSRSIDFPVNNIFVMDGSSRSTKSNAFFTGFGKNKRIVLFDTLIKDHTVDELLAILAHEMGHYKKKHIQKRLVTGILQMGVVFYLVSVFISSPGLFEAFFMENISIYAGLIFFGMLYSPIDMVISIFMQMASRKDEFEADAFAAETTLKTQPLIDALKKLSVNNLSNLDPHPFYVFLNYSHPPVLHRISRLKKQG